MVGSWVGFEYIWLLPLLPALAFALITLVTRNWRGVSAFIAIAAASAALVLAVELFREVMASGVTMESPVECSYSWLALGAVKIEAGLLIDPLSVLMLLIVTSVTLAVEVYSLGYMARDPGWSVFFAYLSLFAASMLGLVLANNYFMLYFFWELVGLCSYLLIGFWYHRPAAARAGFKAFAVNRLADFGLLLGILCLWGAFGSFNFRALALVIPNCAEAGLLTTAALLVFTGVVGKSAQFPLHVWLPDAMEGPTPVSALIHAATMVAAGVYLLARTYVLFVSAPEVMLLVAYTGGLTAFMAATVALVQRDIKRILAYSTISQLGYMVMAMGIGSMSAAMFHLTTHAFFKALLFLAAGSVIHAAHEQDIFRLRGVARDMKVTTITFIIGALALVGMPPFSGFWSKDEILAETYRHGFTGLYVLGTLVAFLTAWYVFRLVFVVFGGKQPAERRAQESPPVMTVPLLVLAAFSVLVGLVGTPYTAQGFGSWVAYGPAHQAHPNYTVMAISTLVALGGIGLAWLLHGRLIVVSERWRERWGWAYRCLQQQYYLDEFYTWVYRGCFWRVAEAFHWHDRHLVDGTFDGLGKVIYLSGAKLRYLQTGNLQVYALVFLAAVTVMTLWLAFPLLGGLLRCF
ncbi:NADH-quinone oxidoreductase subunit L [Desulfothermobacter acidiphilus]|uniref:NADH-quinone oxidoreductase subunit L n=1 Tax=Desulfothermobacter acidiphilus TaxID=1938353 RepID=UPI003F8CD6BE